MAGAAGHGGEPQEGRRRPGGAYGRAAVADIRARWEAGLPPICPGCGLPLDTVEVPARDDVAYVRRRVILVCRECHRTAALERRDEGRKARAGGGRPVGDQEPASPSTRALPCVGWREWVRLGDAPHVSLKAKVDTGARSSALHAEDIRPVERVGPEGPEAWLRFRVLPAQRSRDGFFEIEAPLVDRRTVRSSTGNTQLRPVVRLELELGTHRFPAEVTLTRRDMMGFRMLLGRTALRGRFLVDPGSSYRLGTGDREPPPPPSGARTS